MIKSCKRRAWYDAMVFLFNIVVVLNNTYADKGKQQKEGNDENQICDRAKSRNARMVIETVLYPQLNKQGFSPPLSCPLNASYDMFLKQEHHKQRKGRRHWSCGFCNQTYRNEKALDNHMSQVHSHESYEGTKVCLADYCDALHCDWFKFEVALG
eukprot:TRINITY_DN8384_c0_g4_i1.p1 TRINITY_DN8384_c0_g4~~TRINITY_DN8384_c0_g4_i1.p1  ORF type:complete len:163 (-),score=11.42 TRINITY_DN8384_c0_g4_i1:75-539(-)